MHSKGLAKRMIGISTTFKMDFVLEFFNNSLRGSLSNKSGC